jgi:GT2 family glycosyltransferase
MTHQRITAALTAYNAEATIEEALISAYKQDWPDIEILIVDDGSSDGTVDIVERFIVKFNSSHRPIRLIRMPSNGGVAQARNRLIQEATGVFLAFFDDDDQSRLDRISRQYERISYVEKQLGHDFILCHTARDLLHPSGIVRRVETMGCGKHLVPSGNLVAQRILLGRIGPGVIGSCATCSQMGRLSVYQRLCGFDPELRRSEDTDFNIRFALAGGAFAGLDDALVLQTMTMSADKSCKIELAEYSVLINKFRGYLQSIGWYEFCVRWQSVRSAYFAGNTINMLIQVAQLSCFHPIKLCLKLYWTLPASAARRTQIYQFRMTPK